MGASVTRKVLVDRLAQCSHDVYVRHSREMGRPEAEIVQDVNQHDIDRALAVVQVLEELGVWAEPDELKVRWH